MTLPPAWDLSRSVAFLHLTAEYLAADQKLALAEKIYTRLKQYTDATDKGACYHYWTGGAIAMAKSNPQAAVEHLEKAAEITTVGTDFYAFYMLARAYLEAGQLSQAVELFEHLQSVYSADRLSETIANVKLHYYTAIAYQESRWYSRAAEEYQTFLDLWSEPDSQSETEARSESEPEPESYLIVDARARLAQVKTNL